MITGPAWFILTALLLALVAFALAFVAGAGITYRLMNGHSPVPTIFRGRKIKVLAGKKSTLDRTPVERPDMRA